MTRSFLLLFTLFFTISFAKQINAQYCATPDVPHEFDLAAFKAYKSQKKATTRSNQNRKIAIAIHVVQELAGAANIDVTKLYEEVDAVNRFFQGTNLEFFICGAPRVIQERTFFSKQESDRILNARYHVPNAINIFYVDVIGDDAFSSFACGISTFPWDGPASTRSILMLKECSTNGAVLAHEIGHFLGLYHTHTTIMGVESVDGSNCEVAGDFICDTPADPNLGFVGLNGCTYVSDIVDFNGDIYEPDPTNIMSYSPARCQTKFTPEQGEVMNFYLESTDLSDLISDCDFYPDFSLATTASLPQIVTSGQTIEITYFFDNKGITEDQEVEIHFGIQSLDGTRNFTFIIHKETLLISPDQASFEQTFHIQLPPEYGTGQYQITTSLDPSSVYLERDKRNNFHDFDFTIDNSNLIADAVYPNPVNDQATLFLKDRGLSGQFTASIHDYMGRTYHEQPFFKNEEEFLFRVDVPAIPAGLYILTIRFERNGDQRSYLIWKE